MCVMRYAIIVLAAVGSPNLGDVWAADPAATPQPATELTVLPGFRAERLLSVPRDYASWINMTFDPQGRIIVSDQGQQLHRITPAPLGQPGKQTTVEPLQLGVGGAHGLLYAQQSLFVVTGGPFPESGIFRLRDTDGQGSYAAAERLLKIDGRGEHGPHGIVLGPHKQWLYVIAGNGSRLPSGLTRNHVARIGETQHASVPKPQGWVMRISIDGKRRELFCLGLRNSFDLAFDPSGELFTFDSDNEGFYGLPWYRPTNIYHLVSGADYGWRQSPGNLLSGYPDTVPPVTEIGPGSPTGLVFGTQTSFPEPYQAALFACDWSYGRIYSVELQPSGASWTAGWRFFASGRPLPVSDIAVGPDGALYFVTGGRSTQSHLYRIFWTGKTSHPPTVTDPPATRTAAERAQQTRRRLDAFQGVRAANAVSTAWPLLNSSDRAIRYAARSAIEHQPVNLWQERALSESDLQSALEALVALARQGDPELRKQILKAAEAIDWNQLAPEQRLALLRMYAVTLHRMGIPDAGVKNSLRNRIDAYYPSEHRALNRELADLLYKMSPNAQQAKSLTDRTLDIIETLPTLMEQIHYVLLIASRGTADLTDKQKLRLRRALDDGELRTLAERPYAEQRKTFGKLLTDLGIPPKASTNEPQRQLIKAWTLQDLQPLLKDAALESADLARGQAIYRSARCAICHRLGNTGGVLGPALDGLAGRYSRQVILESLVLPSQVVADQYRSSTFVMRDGRVITGRIVNLNRSGYTVQSDPLRAFARLNLPVEEIEQLVPSKVSLMPKGLLDTFTQTEIRDLLKYLLVRSSQGIPLKSSRRPTSE